ncbi:MAG TPA: ATP-binding protein, partial [Actinomycetota bacterium]|nr:ATP-binding protein [Actinomycetota bacterium]
MDESIEWLDYVLLAGFALVSLLAFRRWRLGGGRAMAIIGGAIGLLALVSGIGKIGEATDYEYRFLFDITIAAFLGSGYLLILFRHQFLPVPRWIRIGAFAISAGAAGYLIAQQLEYGPDVQYEGSEYAALLLLLGVWAASVFEPSIQFWRAGRKRPKVQRARLRSLSAAYLGIIAILIVAIALGQDANQTVSNAIQLATLALVPLLAAAVVPPRWLRRVWRAPEEEALRASRELVMFAPDRQTLSSRALDWAARLVGGDAGYIATPGGDVIAEMGMPHDDACDLAARLHPHERPEAVPLAGESSRAIVAPIPTEQGICSLVVLSGPFAQLFGTDEIERLGEYAEEIGVALDRVHLIEEMGRLDQARRAFIANAAHELRTPLTAILGFSSMVAADPRRMPPEQLQQAMEAVHRHSLRMRTLVNNLLDLTQIDAGKLNVSVVPVSLPEAARQALESAPVPEDKSVSLDVPDVKVVADRLRLEQVIANLLVNAYKYGGSHVSVTGHKENGSVVVSVIDNGLGIAEPLRSRLFEPFVRGAAVGKEGSGLGLAIVRSLLRAFGGDIWYEDVSPHGAR